MKWISFFEYIFALVRDLKNFLLSPIEHFFGLFGLTLSVVTKSYLFIGLVVAISHFFASRLATNVFMTSIRRRVVLSLIIWLVWPLFYLVMLISPILLANGRIAKVYRPKSMMDFAFIAGFHMVALIAILYFVSITITIALIFGINSLLN